jgi:IS5 family transposase
MAIEDVVYGDAGYQGIARRPEMADNRTGFRVAMRPGKGRGLANTLEERQQDLIDMAKNPFCSKFDNPFQEIKQ